jgi:RNA polymerase sigma-B factor
MGLVHSVAQRFARRSGEPVEDLVQVGAIGLIKAVDRYDPSKGRKLRALAVPAIEGEIRHHLRDRTALVRTPRPVHELGARARKAQADLTARDGKAPEASAVAEAVGAGEDEVEEALAAGRPTVELDAEAVAAPDADPAQERALVSAGLEGLSEREQTILRLRFYDDRSQADIAKEVGLSQAHVSRLISRALDRLRASVDDASGRPPTEPMSVPEIQPRRPAAKHSGRLLVRMPQTLHTELAEQAEREGVSLNTLITNALSQAVGEDGRGPEPPPERPRAGWTSYALAANLVVVGVAGVVAIILLVIAVRQGW